MTPPPPSPDLPAAGVLVVDDLPENLAVLGELLSGAGYRVQVATSGPVALRLACTVPQPDLILLDVMMPVMDGYEVLARLQAQPATSRIPVVFLTARGDPDDEEFGLKQGAVDYLTKPIVPSVVLARVRTHLLAKRGQDWLHDQNALLEAEVARRMQENEHIQRVTIRALALLAETRDPETGNHILRTQAYMEILARALASHPRFAAALDNASIEHLVRSAPLHDIGKVGIPDHILLKPSRLDPQEWEIMKTHARLGAEALERAEGETGSPLAFLVVARQVARSHHEHWDGSGYPDGLRGEI